LKPHDFIKTAGILLASGKHKPTMVCLRRAVSSCYYALFHCLARDCADLLIGGSGSQKSVDAWRQVYRSLEHGATKDRCKDGSMIKKFPKPIEDFANAFVQLQDRRHSADYDPMASFTKVQVAADILLVEGAIAAFKSAPLKDRRAFCAYVLLRKPRS
jgi:hypothetical protein